MANGRSTVAAGFAARAVLVGEVLLFVAAVMAYIWLLAPTAGHLQWYHVAGIIVLGAFPVCMNLLHGDRPRDSGIRLDNLAAASKPVAAVTIIFIAGIVIVGLATGGFHWVKWRRFAELCGGYLAWGLVQQYLLQAFAMRRLKQAAVPTLLAAIIAAGLFAFIHSPNWPLVALTFVAGVAWCLLFARRPNLLPLGAAHAVLAVLLYHAWPVSWLDGLTIGTMYHP